MPEPPDVPMQDVSHVSETPCSCSNYTLPEPPQPYTRPPTYHWGAYGVGTSMLLQPCHYHAVELVAWTGERWDDPGFQEYCTPLHRRIIAVLGPWLQSKLHCPNKTRKWKNTKECNQSVQEMFYALDICLFFGTMTQPFGRRRDSLAKMEIYKGQGDGLHLGSTWVENNSFGERRARIVIYPRLDKTKTQSLAEMIETLVHEMIHAYLDLFVCQGHVCTKEAPRTVGTHAHGAAFFLLQARITNIIRSWDPELRSFMTGVSSYGTKKSLIDTYSLFLELDQRAKLASVKTGSNNCAEPFAHEGFSRLPGFRAEYADLMDNIALYPQYKRDLEEGRKKKLPQVQKGPKVSGKKPIPCKGVTPKGKRPCGAGR